MPMIRKLLHDDPAGAESLARYMLDTRTPVAALQSVGLAENPAVLELLRNTSQRQMNREVRGQVVHIAYHCDNATLFKHLPNYEYLPNDDPDGAAGLTLLPQISCLPNRQPIGIQTITQ